MVKKICLILFSCLIFVFCFNFFNLHFYNVNSVSASNGTMNFSPYNVHYLTNWTSHSVSINVDGQNFWSDGQNIYYSAGLTHYILNSDYTLSPVTFTGLTDFMGYDVWSYHNNVYCSNGFGHYLFNSSTLTWTSFTFINNVNFKGLDVFYYSVYDKCYAFYSNDLVEIDLNVPILTSSVYYGFTDNITGAYLFTIDSLVCYSIGGSDYSFDVLTKTFSLRTWSGLPNNSVYNGSRVWTDGTNYYWSSGTSHYIYDTSYGSWSSVKPVNVTEDQEPYEVS